MYIPYIYILLLIAGQSLCSLQNFNVFQRKGFRGLRGRGLMFGLIRPIEFWAPASKGCPGDTGGSNLERFKVLARGLRP